MQLAADLGLVTTGGTFFDYGCGRGDDVAGLARAGVMAAAGTRTSDPMSRGQAQKSSTLGMWSMSFRIPRKGETQSSMPGSSRKGP